jgi:hypothetical protein
MPLRWTPIQRIGQFTSSVRHGIGRVDKAIHLGGRIFHAVKEHLPPSKLKHAAERGLSDYEAVRQKVRMAGVG